MMMDNNEKSKNNEKSNNKVRKVEIDDGNIMSKINKAQKKVDRKTSLQEESQEPESEKKVYNSYDEDGSILFEENVKKFGKVKPEYKKQKDIINNYDDDDDKDDDDTKAMMFFDDENTQKEDFPGRVRRVKEENDSLNTKREDDNKNKNNPLVDEILDWAKHILIAVIIGVFLVVFVVQRNEVIGSSMEPNLYENDQLLVQKITKLYDSGIKYGDIITINAAGLPGHYGDNNIIKRVIGLPGDLVEIKDGQIYRNNEKLKEEYLTGVKTDTRNPDYSVVYLDENQFYLLGDNRNVSLDSRTFGPVERDRIIGEVLIRFYPFNSFGRP